LRVEAGGRAVEGVDEQAAEGGGGDGQEVAARAAYRHECLFDYRI
jgi:hypothetical protein